jgi:hypothetical protein
MIRPMLPRPRFQIQHATVVFFSQCAVTMQAFVPPGLCRAQHGHYMPGGPAHHDVAEPTDALANLLYHGWGPRPPGPTADCTSCARRRGGRGAAAANQDVSGAATGWLLRLAAACVSRPRAAPEFRPAHTARLTPLGRRLLGLDPWP